MSILQDAVDFVQDEAVALGGRLGQDHTYYPFYASLSAMNFVQSRLSSARWSLLSKQPGFVAPVGVEDHLRQGIGICGNQTQLFIKIMTSLSLPCRDVQIYYKGENEETLNHIFPEVFWDGKWHMFDTTWGWYPWDKAPENVLSFEETQTLDTYNRLEGETNSWAYAVKRNIGEKMFAYLKGAEYGVLYDGAGWISPPMEVIEEGVQNANLESLPKYIGLGELESGKRSELYYKLDLPTETYSCVLLKLRLNEGDVARVTVGPWEKFLNESNIVVCPNVKGPTDIHLKPFAALPGNIATWEKLVVVAGNDQDFIEKCKIGME